MGILQLFLDAAKTVLSKDAAKVIGKAVRDQAYFARSGVRSGGFAIGVDQAGRRTISLVEIARDMEQNNKTANQAARDALTPHLYVNTPDGVLQGEEARRYQEAGKRVKAERKQMLNADKPRTSPAGRVWQPEEIRAMTASDTFDPKPGKVRNPKAITDLAEGGLWNRMAAADDRARSNLIKSMTSANVPEPLFSAMAKAVGGMSANQVRDALSKLSAAETYSLYSSSNALVTLNLKKAMAAFGIDVNQYAEEIEQLESHGIRI